jgi:hypothetical protein
MTIIQDHLDDTNNPHDLVAGQVAIVDSGDYYTATEVEAALQEIYALANAKADADTTVLLDNSSQTVNAAKPKVVNLNVDKLDGFHASASPAANSIPVLDANAKIVLSEIPDILTEKSVTYLSGFPIGAGNNMIPALKSGATAVGRLMTSMLGKAVMESAFVEGGIPQMTAVYPPANYKLHSSLLGATVGVLSGSIPRLAETIITGWLHMSLLGVEVGVGNDMIPQISTSEPPEAGKVHESLLGVNAGSGRSASSNMTDVPAPDKYGGGRIWLEKYIAAADESDIVIDNVIDWRDRFVIVSGFMATGVSKIAGATDNHVIGGSVNGASDDAVDTSIRQNLGEMFLYTQEGTETLGALYPNGSMYSNANGIGGTADDGVAIWASALTGFLMMQKMGATQNYTLILKIDYSPQQKHYS